MFWRFGGYANISTIDTILDKPDFSLEELLDESDLIQELKQHNSKLIEYLRDELILAKLLEYVVAPKLEVFESKDDDDSARGRDGLFGFSRSRTSSRNPTSSEKEDDDEAEKRRNRYALVACEVLSSDTWSIYETLGENEQLIREFWGFLKRDAPLDPLQASYFTKVNESLFEKKTGKMMHLFQEQPDIVADFLKHVECPMIMDLLLKIIALDRADGSNGVVEVCDRCDKTFNASWAFPYYTFANFSDSGSTTVISSRRCLHLSVPRIAGLCRLLQVILLKPSSRFLPTPHKMNNSALVRTN